MYPPKPLEESSHRYLTDLPLTSHAPTSEARSTISAAQHSIKLRSISILPHRAAAHHMHLHLHLHLDPGPRPGPRPGGPSPGPGPGETRKGPQGKDQGQDKAPLYLRTHRDHTLSIWTGLSPSLFSLIAPTIPTYLPFTYPPYPRAAPSLPPSSFLLWSTAV